MNKILSLKKLHIKAPTNINMKTYQLHQQSLSLE